MQFFILLKLKKTNQAEYMRDHWTAARKGRLLLFVQRHYIQHTVADVVVSLCSPLSWSCCVRLLSYHSLATHTGASCLHCSVLPARKALPDPLGWKTPHKFEVLLVQSFLLLVKSQVFSQEIHQHAASKNSIGSKYSSCLSALQN